MVTHMTTCDAYTVSHGNNHIATLLGVGGIDKYHTTVFKIKSITV